MFAYVGKILIDPFNDESLRRLLPKLRYDETKQQQMIDALAKATTDMNSQRGGGEEKYPDWIISGLASLIAKIQQ